MEHERIWIDGLNRGDVSAAHEAFLPDCILHITGLPEPFRGVAPHTEFVAGFFRAFPDLHFTIEQQAIPSALVRGKSKVTIRFQATAPGRIAPVFGVRTIRAN